MEFAMKKYFGLLKFTAHLHGLGPQWILGITLTYFLGSYKVYVKPMGSLFYLNSVLAVEINSVKRIEDQVYIWQDIQDMISEETVSRMFREINNLFVRVFTEAKQHFV